MCFPVRTLKATSKGLKDVQRKARFRGKLQQPTCAGALRASSARAAATALFSSHAYLQRVRNAVSHCCHERQLTLMKAWPKPLNVVVETSIDETEMDLFVCEEKGKFSVMMIQAATLWRCGLQPNEVKRESIVLTGHYQGYGHKHFVQSTHGALHLPSAASGAGADHIHLEF